MERWERWSACTKNLFTNESSNMNLVTVIYALELAELIALLSDRRRIILQLGSGLLDSLTKEVCMIKIPPLVPESKCYEALGLPKWPMGPVPVRWQIRQGTYRRQRISPATLTHHSSALSYVHHQGLLVVQEGAQEGHLPDSVPVWRGGQVWQQGTQSVLSVLISLKSDPPYI